MIYRRYQIFTRICHPGSNRRQWRLLSTMHRLVGLMWSGTSRDSFGTTYGMPDDGAEVDSPCVNLRSSPQASLFDLKIKHNRSDCAQFDPIVCSFRFSTPPGGAFVLSYFFTHRRWIDSEPTRRPTRVSAYHHSFRNSFFYSRRYENSSQKIYRLIIPPHIHRSRPSKALTHIEDVRDYNFYSFLSLFFNVESCGSCPCGSTGVG